MADENTESPRSKKRDTGACEDVEVRNPSVMGMRIAVDVSAMKQNAFTKTLQLGRLPSM